MEFSRHKVVQRHGHLPICPIWVGPWAKNLPNLLPVMCRTRSSEIAGQIYSNQSSVELSRPVVMQHHNNLPIGPIWACICIKILSKQVPLGSRLCRTHIAETTGWTYLIVWSSVELSKPVVVQHHGLMTLTLDFERSNFEKAVSQEFWKVKFWENCISGMGGSIEVEHKGCALIGCWDALCDLELCPWSWIFKVIFWNSCIPGMWWLIDIEGKWCESIGNRAHFVGVGPIMGCPLSDLWAEGFCHSLNTLFIYCFLCFVIVGSC